MFSPVQNKQVFNFSEIVVKRFAPFNDFLPCGFADVEREPGGGEVGLHRRRFLGAIQSRDASVHYQSRVSLRSGGPGE